MGWKAYDSTGSQLQMALTDLPVGTIVGTGRSTAPNNWLLCDGAAYSRTGYAELFSAIGTSYGTGDGSTTFNVPVVDGHIILASSNSSRFGINDGSYLPDNVITTSKIVDKAITQAKIADKTPAKPTYETSLPASPTDGQEIYYAADATNGVIWHLRYRSGSSSSYKWEFVGGSSLTDQDQGPDSLSIASQTWSGINASDPIVTVPFAGDYEISHNATIGLAATGSMAIGVKIGATNPTGIEEPGTAYSYQATGTGRESLRASFIATSVSASISIAQVYWHNMGSTNGLDASGRSIFVTPVRVG